MGYSNYSLIQLIIFFFLFLFHYYSAEALCVARNFTYLEPSSSNAQDVPSPPQTQQELSANTPTADPPSKTPSSSPTLPTDAPKDSPRSLSLINQPMKAEVSASVDTSVKKICASTDYVDVCLSSLAPYLVPGKTDPVSVLESAIKATTEHAKQSMAEATKQAKAPNLPTRKANALSDCQYMFSDALDNLQSATEALPSRDMDTVKTMLSAVITDSETCEDDFTGVSPLADFDAKLRMLGSNCLAIASLIK